MIFSRGRRTTGRRAVTGRGIHSVTQYTASNGSIQTLKGKGKKNLAIVRITKAQLASEVPMWKTRGQRAMGARMVSQVLQNLRITNILFFILEQRD